MTPELTWLALTTLLAASLWIPFVFGANTTAGAKDPLSFVRPPDMQSLPAWVHRPHRAHLNMIETLVPFAAGILIAHVAGVSTSVTVAASIAFFWLRLVHAIGVITGWARMPLRPVLFTASWLCTVGVLISLLVA